MKSSKKLNKIKGYHLSIQGKWKGNLFREKWFIKGQGVRARAGSLYKTCWVPPPPPLGLCQLFGNHVEFTIIKGEPILTVENSNEFFLFFFLSKQHCGKAWGRCYLGIQGILRLSPDSSLTVFFVFQYGNEKTGGRMAGLEWRRRQVFHFQNRKVFLLSQGI